MSQSPTLPTPGSALPTPGKAPVLRRTLGVGALTLFGLTYLAPVTVFTTYGSVTSTTDNRLPAAYVVALIAMLFTALSYGRMSRAYPVSGSAYTYTQQSFGGHVGFLTGWTLMLDYLLLPMINFMLIGIYLNTELPDIPIWVFNLASLLLALIFNVLGINIVKNLNILIVGISVALVVVFSVLCIIYLSGGHITVANPLKPFLPGSGGLGPIFSGAAVLALSFLGFDAVSTMSEEARNPKKDIPRAILLTTLIGGAIFIVVSWFGATIAPNWHVFGNLDNAGIDLMTTVGGSSMAIIFTIVYVIGAFGSGMTTQVSVSRIIYAMGRDGILPRLFGRVHPRWNTPWFAAIVVSFIALAGIWIPLNDVINMISFGALVAFSMVNLSVIRRFLFPGKKRGELTELGAKQWLLYGLLPLIGFALTVWLWTSLAGLTFIVGLSWALLGAIYLFIKTDFFRRKPPVLDFSEN